MYAHYNPLHIIHFTTASFRSSEKFPLSKQGERDLQKRTPSMACGILCLLKVLREADKLCSCWILRRVEHSSFHKASILRVPFPVHRPTRQYDGQACPLFPKSEWHEFSASGEFASSHTFYLRQDPPPPPPLDLSFGHFSVFLHRGIEEVERHLLWKCHKKFERKSWSNVPSKLLACVRFLY